MSSRDSSIQKMLGDPEMRVKLINPSGDCFYEAIAAAFSIAGSDVRDIEAVRSEPDDSAAMALRRTAAMAVNEEAFNNFAMFHEDFAFMRRCSTVEDVRQRMLVSGESAGAGHCLWANEWEIGVICEALGIRCLVIDQEARDLNSRYVSVGSQEPDTKFVILNRTRREHYNLVYSHLAGGLFSYDELSDFMKRLWNMTED